MFRMKPEVDHWFKHIMNTGPIKTKFDLYYFCLIAGLVKGQSIELVNGQEFNDTFVSEYQSSQRIILGMFLIAEMSRLGIEFDDREEIRILINKYFESSSTSNLKNEGYSGLNDYANAGFIFLRENYADTPRRVEDFLQWYITNISKQVEACHIWS